MYNEVEGLDVCPSPVVSPMPKAETARGKSDTGESVAHNMQDALDEMRNCADRIHDVLKESSKPHGDGQVITRHSRTNLSSSMAVAALIYTGATLNGIWESVPELIARPEEALRHK